VGATVNPQADKEAKMSTPIKFALAAAIVLSTVAAAWAAPKRQNVYRNSPRPQATVPRTGAFSNPDSPEATGGGNLGYNQNIYNW
jgi:hypothetical protein